MGVTQPRVANQREWNVGSLAAGLTMEVDDGAAPPHVWFELSDRADLNGSRRVGEQRYDRGNGKRVCNASLSGLTPATTYYYRGRIETVVGSDTGPIQSFRTAATPPRAPDMRLDEIELSVEGGVLGWFVSYTVDGHGLGGRCSGAWSLAADMAGATELDGMWRPQPIDPGPTPQRFFAFVPSAAFAKGTTVYFQGTAKTAGGVTRSDIGSAVVVGG